MRHDLYLILALALLLVALILPRLLRGDLRGALFAFLGVAGVLLGVFGVLFVAGWIAEGLDHPGSGWRGRAVQGVGHLLRFLLCAFVALVVTTALVVHHHAGARVETWVPIGAGGLAGAAGLLRYRQVGRVRFWAGFRLLGLTLIGSLFGGILGILGPEPWSIDIGILLPILLLMLVATQRSPKPSH